LKDFNNLLTMDFFDLSPILDELQKSREATVSGLYGSALSVFIYELARKSGPVVFIAAEDKIESHAHELAELVPATVVVNRQNPFYSARDIVITAPEFLSQDVRIKEKFEFRRDRAVDIGSLMERLRLTGFSREEIAEEDGEFAVRGGILDIFAAGREPVRVELYGDTVESIRRFSAETQRSTGNIDNFVLELAQPDQYATLKDLIPASAVVVSGEKIDLPNPVVRLTADGKIRFRIGSPRPYFGDIKALRADLEAGIYEYILLIASPTRAERLKPLLGEIRILPMPLSAGFIDEDRKLVYLTEYEIFGEIKRRKEQYRGLFVDDLKGLKDLDYVVHSDFGIGQFRGLAIMEVEGSKIECLRIDYADNGRVFLPVERINLLERYVGSTDKIPKLSKLGGEVWIRTKKKVKKATEKMAFDLIRLYAQRMQTPGFAFPKESLEESELEAGFPYEETEDQIKAIRDVKRDMEAPKPQERLICGDVGYGKTEIALRAAFKAALAGKQTAVLCPTTLLAFQHFNTFQKRLGLFPVRVEMVSRFRKKEDLKKVLAGLTEGKVDIVIGTHRLLQPDIEIPNLGLLVIDEEQRFGVIQKEKFKKLKPGIDILYLSATPIPRTLYMALTGIKDISNIHTPPPGRKDIETRIIFWDDDKIKRIIEAELNRGGQVFFIHNRIQSIEIIRSRLQNLLPDVRIGLIHGQMRTDLSEHRMIGFLEGKYHLLLSTAIVESGLDMPRVNTIIVNDAHKFGLADLHQLRGRVGRSDQQAYAYFIIPESRTMSEEANKRLSAINSYTSLGSGFRLALRDMEIRGIGDLLGKEQSGVMDSVGYHHYIKILSASVNEMRGSRVLVEPVLSLKIDAYFPSAYIESAYERTALYKRLLDVESKFELESIRNEILDRFGRYPKEVKNLFYVSELRLRAIELDATEVIQRGDKIVFFRKNNVIDHILYEDKD
jgi:transcription-repair coupling factor